MSNFVSGFKSFIHSLTTSDHYASYDPERPATSSNRDQHQPLTTEYPSYPRASSGSRSGSTTNLGSAAYQQGSRSQQFNSTPSGSQTNLADAGPSIPLEEYGEPRPVPSPVVSWQRIDRWIENNYPELFDQLQEGVTSNDLNELEHDLDCQLPIDVRTSFEQHDGQERGGKPTGLFYGVTLLDVESVSEEWTVWRNTAVRLNEQRPSARANGSVGWSDRQRSFPPDAVQPVYAHPAWIPLAKDFGGNNIGVDLAPGPKGRLGQVILFGRDFDTKYVVAPSWGDFIDQFATDLESNNCFIDEDIEDAVFAYKLPSGRLASYFEILRSRVERAYRRANPQPSSSIASPKLISPNQSNVSLPMISETKPSEETVLKLTPAAPKSTGLADAKTPAAEPKTETKPEATPEIKTPVPESTETKPEASETTETTETKAETEPETKPETATEDISKTSDSLQQVSLDNDAEDEESTPEPGAKPLSKSAKKKAKAKAKKN